MITFAELTKEKVLTETEKIRYLYNLKRIIRYNLDREEEYDTESVAEHVFGIFVLAEYFLPLEDPEGLLDKEKIRTMALFHDTDEVETGDTLTYLKTDTEMREERAAQEKAIAHMPEHMQHSVRVAMDEYEARKTKEAKFVKALDKLEPTFHVFYEKGKDILNRNKTTRENWEDRRDEYIEPFSYLRRFHEVISDIMEERGFFYKETK